MLYFSPSPPSPLPGQEKISIPLTMNLTTSTSFLATDYTLKCMEGGRERIHVCICLLPPDRFIARGEFGEVYQGSALDILGHGTGATPVAVKTLRKGSTPDEQRKFLSEAALML